jgi:hypothetical protein
VTRATGSRPFVKRADFLSETSVARSATPDPTKTSAGWSAGLKK